MYTQKIDICRKYHSDERPTEYSAMYNVANFV